MKKDVTNKSQPVTKEMVWAGWLKVKSNGGGPGVDKQTLLAYEADLGKQLYKVWNRMASGSYRPPAVREVDIPKGGGKMRTLGIPTVGDRVAQTVVKQYLEGRMEAIFHSDSYGYRSGRSAHDAIAQTQRRCWDYGWVIDLDIRGFFDHLDHELLNLALDKHVEEKWCRLYIDRWLKSPVEKADGTQIVREEGSPQGGVISPLLANLFLHYGFDMWMSKYYPQIGFERYADDIIIHCKSQEEAENLLIQIRARMNECKLELHPEKTQIAFCPQQNRRAKYPNRKFTFLGYEFKARKVFSKEGKSLTGFNPAVSPKATSKFLKKFSEMGLHRWTQWSLEQIAKLVNPTVSGWMAYFSRFNYKEMRRALNGLNSRLICWAAKKFKRHKRSFLKAKEWLKKVAKHNPALFAHWKAGFLPGEYIRGAV